jgi:hypothetical protein
MVKLTKSESVRQEYRMYSILYRVPGRGEIRLDPLLHVIDCVTQVGLDQRVLELILVASLPHRNPLVMCFLAMIFCISVSVV